MEDRFLNFNVIENIVEEHNYFMNLLEFNNNCFAKVIYSDGEIFYKNGNRYKGPMYNGLMEGKGEIQFNDGTVYKGNFSDNNMDGFGELNWSNGSYYKGNFKNNKREGKGQLKIFKNNFIYDGEFKNGKPNGLGTAYYSNKSQYNGYFLNGIRNGKGIYKYESGNYYEGIFKNNSKNGFGIMNWVNQNEYYEGEWVNNQISIYGRYIWKGLESIPNNRYEGEYLNGLRNGYGIFYYSDGSVYLGKWINDKKEDNSIYINENGYINYIKFTKDRTEDYFKNEDLNINNDKENVYKKKINISLFIKNEEITKLLYNKLLKYNSLLVKIFKIYNTNNHDKFGKNFTVKNFLNFIRDCKLINGYLTLPNLLRYYYKQKRTRNLFLQSLKYIKSRLNFMNNEDINSKLDFIFNEYNNPFYSFHNENNILYFRNFVQLLLTAIYLKSYFIFSKKNFVKDSKTKNHIWESNDFINYFDSIIHHINLIINKKKIPKSLFYDEEIIINKSNNLINKYKDKILNLYNTLLNYQENYRFIKKIDLNYKIKYDSIDEDILYYKNFPKFEENLESIDFKYLKLEIIYKIFSELGFLENDYIMEDSESTRLNQSNIIYDKRILFFKIFERKNDGEESYYNFLNNKKNWKNKNHPKEVLFLKKILEIEIFFDDFLYDLFIYIVKLGQVSGKDKRFEIKTERKINIFFDIINKYFKKKPPIKKNKKKPRILPYSFKDDQLKNIIEIKNIKLKEKTIFMKKKKEQENVLKEVKSMTLNDYNTLLIKDEDEDYESEDYIEDTGNSLYIYKED